MKRRMGIDRIEELEYQLEEARAWADWFSVQRKLSDEAERGSQADLEALWPAANAAEEALLQLGINPNEEEPSWKR